MMTLLLLHIQISSQKKGRSVVGLCHAYFFGYLVQQGHPLNSQQFDGLSLGFLPSRNCFLDQSLTLGSQPERLGTSVFFRHDLQPAVRLQWLDVATESGSVQLQNLANLGWASQAEFGGHDQDV